MWLILCDDTFYLGIDEATKYLVLVKSHGSNRTVTLEAKVFYQRILRKQRSMTISIILNLTLTRVILLVSPSWLATRPSLRINPSLLAEKTCWVTRPPFTSSGVSRWTEVTGALWGVTPVRDCPDVLHHRRRDPSLLPWNGKNNQM